MKADLEGALRIFKEASNYIQLAGLNKEIEWQRNACLENITESDLLRETAWVILCSGFRESVVRRIFDHISLCFCDWESAHTILDSRPGCLIAAHEVFRNKAKLEAIMSVAIYIDKHGFNRVKRSIIINPIEELIKLPYIGPITVWHLAKNLGYDVAKPDRHLVRLSSNLGFESVTDFCGAISRVSGEATKVVDLIVWRYIADINGARVSIVNN